VSALLEEFDVQRLYPPEPPPRPTVYVLTSMFSQYLLQREGVVTLYIDGEPVAEGHVALTRCLCNTPNVDC
jgi:hypothetical protein